MLWTAFVTILLLWCLGSIVSVTLSGFIHLLPCLAAILALVGTVQSRRVI